jgi:hypothetical protein
VPVRCVKLYAHVVSLRPPCSGVMSGQCRSLVLYRMGCGGSRAPGMVLVALVGPVEDWMFDVRNGPLSRVRCPTWHDEALSAYCCDRANMGCGGTG